MEAANSKLTAFNRQDFVGLDPILDSNGGGMRRKIGATEGIVDATLNFDPADGLHGEASVAAGCAFHGPCF